MELWRRLLALLRTMKPRPEWRHFELDALLQAALKERADREQRPLQQFQADLLAAGLANLQTSDELKRCWKRLSGANREVTALTCLGYTNRQMAARLGSRRVQSKATCVRPWSNFMRIAKSSCAFC